MLRQGSSNASVRNFVLGFLKMSQRVTKPSFEDILFVASAIPRQKYVIRL